MKATDVDEIMTKLDERKILPNLTLGFLERNFSVLDANHDSKVTYDEIEAHQVRFAYDIDPVPGLHLREPSSSSYIHGNDPQNVQYQDPRYQRRFDRQTFERKNQPGSANPSDQSAPQA